MPTDHAVLLRDIPVVAELEMAYLISYTNQQAQLAEKFAKGVRLFTKSYKIPVIGGDLIRGKECSVSVGVCGEINQNDFLLEMEQRPVTQFTSVESLDLQNLTEVNH